MTEPKSNFSSTQPPIQEWLEKALPEEPIRPEMPIVDVHMHLWHHASGYRYFVEEFARDIEASGRNVEASIYIDCGSYYRADGPADMRSVGETQFAAGMAAIAESGKYGPTRVAAGIVANVDMAAEPARLTELLDAHEAAANGRLRGIRRSAKWDADPVVASGKIAPNAGVLLDPAFQAGVATLAARDLIYEATIFHPQITDVTSLAKAAPDTRIVVDHCASPLGYSGYRGREAEVHAAWLADMRELAQCPNASVKLSGLLMSLGNFDFRAADRPPTGAELADLWREWLVPVVELFGAERCMGASNYPVEKAGLTFGSIWNALMIVFEDASDAELDNIFHGSARRIYRL